MKEEIYFRFIVQFLEEAALNGARILREEGFKVYDLLESDIVYDSDGSKDSSVYIYYVVEAKRLNLRGLRNNENLMK